MLVWIIPVYAFAMVCNSAGGGSNAATSIYSLDNDSHNNCVDADKAAWAIDKIYFLQMFIALKESKH